MLDITKKQKKISYIAGSITSFLIAFKMHYAEDVGILFKVFLILFQGIVCAIPFTIICSIVLEVINYIKLGLKNFYKLRYLNYKGFFSKFFIGLGKNTLASAIIFLIFAAVNLLFCPNDLNFLAKPGIIVIISLPFSVIKYMLSDFDTKFQVLIHIICVVGAIILTLIFSEPLIVEYISMRYYYVWLIFVVIWFIFCHDMVL